MKKAKTIVKGLPSGFAVSLMLHAAAFLLAGMLVVFTVSQKEEKKFVPPKPVDRPKMKLKKPKVKVKKTARPRSTARIVTKVKRTTMPEIQLPEMGGMAEGVVGGLDGIEVMPDLGQVSVFGSSHSIGSDFVGTFYDFKRTRRGSMAPPMDVDKYNAVVGEFIAGGWKTSKLARFYRSPKQLYATSFMVSGVPSEFGPWAFGEPGIAGYNYLLHYKGKIVYPQGGRFRFWGMGDNVLVVRVGGKVVFDYGNQFTYAWDGEESRRSSYHMAHWPAFYGSWFELEPGVALDMELIFGETAGGLSAVMLAVEEEGVDYPRNFENGPMLPIFKTAELGLDEVDAIYEYLYEDHYCVTNGPVFNDYSKPMKRALAGASDPATVEKTAPPQPPALRTWTLADGRNVEAELVMRMGDKLVLKNTRGKTLKIPVGHFSAADLDYVELQNPPPLKLTFQKDIDHIHFKALPIASIPPAVEEMTCGVKIEKTNRTPYTKELKAELFTFGTEIDGKNYILLDRQERRFSFGGDAGNVFEFMGRTVSLRDYYDGNGDRRGERLAGRLILITDARGKVIASKVSNPWMLENLETIRTFPVGRHISSEGKRVHPPRPNVCTVHWEAWL